MNSSPWNKLARLAEKSPLRVLGLMTGTSMDGLDLCLADIGFVSEGVAVDLVHFVSVPFRAGMEARIRAATSGPAPEVSSLDYDLGRWYARTVRKGLDQDQLASLDLVGCHGQTLHHVSGHSTLQVGEASFLARALEVPVVSDFRAADISAGGTGAPLIPRVHEWLFRHREVARIVLNLGGVANVTLLPPVGAEPVLGFDTGPGMALLDEVYRSHFQNGFDRAGALALTGKVQKSLVRGWLKDRYFQRPPPKSTGRDRFGPGWIAAHQTDLSALPLTDQLATLSYFSAAAVYAACEQFIHRQAVGEVIVSGGGYHNAALRNHLQQCFGPVEIRPAADFGIDGDAVEALGFAILAAAWVIGIPGNIPSVTGADRAVLLGKLTL